MKKIFLICFIATINILQAASENMETISEYDAEQATSQQKGKESPFLIEREDAKQAAATAAASNVILNRLYPPRHSISKQIANFCKHLVGIMESSLSQTPLLRVTITPALFSVTEYPELSVTLKITNDKKEMIMLHFPTNQRLEIVVKNAQGAVLSRWSQDRSFDTTDDTMVINPQESVVYTENISTAGMQNGKRYIVEVSLVNQPGYTITQTITPNIPTN